MQAMYYYQGLIKKQSKLIQHNKMTKKQQGINGTMPSGPVPVARDLSHIMLGNIQ